jgi:hypothetical protein
MGMSPLPSPRSAVRSAFRSGSLVSVFLGQSSRSPSGVVLRCSFGRWLCAARFARRWAGRLGVPVVVRVAGAGWSVSVPVFLGSSRWPAGAGWVQPVAGVGVRGLRPFLARLGFVF